MEKNNTPLPLFRLLVTLMLALGAPPALGDPSPLPEFLTRDGFDELLAKSTLYSPVPMEGVIGVSCPAESVYAVLKSAADNPHITHAVFMIDSESGWPLGREHIGTFDNDLDITALVRTALAPAIFPAFFADRIYMTENALIGGLPLHAFTLPGSEEVTAKQVGIYSSMLASAAQSRGHSDAIAYAMIDHKKTLYAWEKDGKTILANNKPNDTKTLDNFKEVRSALPGSVLTLDRKTAVRLGFAKPIDAYDDLIVGEYIGKKGWLPANKFGMIANQIGSVVAELEPLRESIRDYDNRLRETGNEGSDGYREYKRVLDKAVETLDMINHSLEKLYQVHPERHAYFTAADGRTVIADPEQWVEDLSEARGHVNRAAGMLDRLTSDFKKLGGDGEVFYDLNQRMRVIVDHLQGIAKHGNGAYWRDHAEPEEPEDVYG